MRNTNLVSGQSQDQVQRKTPNFGTQLFHNQNAPEPTNFDVPYRHNYVPFQETIQMEINTSANFLIYLTSTTSYEAFYDDVYMGVCLFLQPVYQS